jgi:hypothetical protein
MNEFREFLKVFSVICLLWLVFIFGSILFTR